MRTIGKQPQHQENRPAPPSIQYLSVKCQVPVWGEQRMYPGVKLSLDPLDYGHRAPEEGRNRKLAGDDYKRGCISNKREVIRFPSQQPISKAIGRNSDQSGLGVGNSFFFSLFLIMFCFYAMGCPAVPGTQNVCPLSHHQPQ